MWCIVQLLLCNFDRPPSRHAHLAADQNHGQNLAERGSGLGVSFDRYLCLHKIRHMERFREARARDTPGKLKKDIRVWVFYSPLLTPISAPSATP